jgi:hypothetical protein
VKDDLLVISNSNRRAGCKIDEENRRSVNHSNEKAAREDVSRIPLLFKNKHKVLPLCSEVPIMR